MNKTEGCWFWTGPTKWNGYGQLWVNGKVTYVHRFSYELANGTIPEKMGIHHTCENKLCVNPSHMEIVYQGEHNKIHDRVSKDKLLDLLR